MILKGFFSCFASFAAVAAIPRHAFVLALRLGCALSAGVLYSCSIVASLVLLGHSASVQLRLLSSCWRAFRALLSTGPFDCNDVSVMLGGSGFKESVFTGLLTSSSQHGQRKNFLTHHFESTQKRFQWKLDGTKPLKTSFSGSGDVWVTEINALFSVS
jgi:hypothetical protein